MANLIHAPDEIHDDFKPRVFLGGTIDNGDSPDWQSEVYDRFKHFDVTFLNPRRPNWSAQADQIEIKRQIQWELHALKTADSVLIYFAPGSQSPISLLEMGIYVQSKKLVVCCPPKFYRYMNVKTTCEWFNAAFHESLDEAVAHAITKAVQLKRNRES